MPGEAKTRRAAKSRAKAEKQDPSNGAGNTEVTPKWTFLTNHSHVLVLVHSNPDVVLRQVALEVGITERAVQRIIQDLEAAGFIERERVGRRNRYKVLVDQPLRHAIESHRNIGDLLNLIAKDDES